MQSKSQPQRRGEYNVYSTFQSHEPEFDYLKSLEIEEKINKIKWLPQQNAAYFLLSTNGQSVSYGNPRTVRLTQLDWSKTVKKTSIFHKNVFKCGRSVVLLSEIVWTKDMIHSSQNIKTQSWCKLWSHQKVSFATWVNVLLFYLVKQVQFEELCMAVTAGTLTNTHIHIYICQN